MRTILVGSNLFGFSYLIIIYSGTRLSDSLLSPSPTTSEASSLVPTIEVIHHTTPKISPLSGASRSAGFDPDYIIVKTSSGTNPDGEEDDEGNTILKFSNANGGQD